MLSIRILLHPKHFSQFIAIAHLIFFLCFQCNGGHGTKGGEEGITTDRERGEDRGGHIHRERGREGRIRRERMREGCGHRVGKRFYSDSNCLMFNYVHALKV